MKQSFLITHIVDISADGDEKARREPLRESNDHLKYIIVGIVLGIVLLLIIAAAVFIWRKMKKNKRKLSADPDSADPDSADPESAERMEDGDFTDIRPADVRTAKSGDLTALAYVHTSELGDVIDTTDVDDVEPL